MSEIHQIMMRDKTLGKYPDTCEEVANKIKQYYLGKLKDKEDVNGLLPCPFCDGDVRTHNPDGYTSGLGKVICNKCGAGFTGVGTSGLTRGHWNTRKSLADVRKVIED